MPAGKLSVTWLAASLESPPVLEVFNRTTANGFAPAVVAATLLTAWLATIANARSSWSACRSWSTP